MQEEWSNYWIKNADRLATPAVVVYPDMVEQNLRRAVHLVGGDPLRLRPHAKTHKTAEVAQLAQSLGIVRHKCATLAEAEMLARAGAKDILVAYPLVGPNPERLVRLARQHPSVRLSALVDHRVHVEHLLSAVTDSSVSIGVVLDIDAGMGRTGIALGKNALDLYRRIAQSPPLVPRGLQVYDGDVEDPDPLKRRERVEAMWSAVRPLIEEIDHSGLALEEIVVAGTGTFPIWLEIAASERRMTASPGTFVFSDWNYHHRYSEQGMRLAALLLTRVVSKPRANRLTFDLGHKAVAADAPGPKRVHFLNLPKWEFVRQNEEHLVVDTPLADRYEPGDVFYAVPYHICPTCALHAKLVVVKGGQASGYWPVASRDRQTSVDEDL